MNGYISLGAASLQPSMETASKGHDLSSSYGNVAVAVSDERSLAWGDDGRRRNTGPDLPGRSRFSGGGIPTMALMENQESIYKLIPPVVPVRPRPPIPKPNYDEKTDAFLTHRDEIRPAATFGRPLGSRKPHSDEWLKKHSYQHYKKDPGVFCCYKKKERPPIPHEKPDMGLCSGKNYVRDNVVRMVLSTPKNLPKPKKYYVDKSDYGKVPRYLIKFNDATTKQRQKLEEAQRQQDLGGPLPNSRKLDESEKRELIIMLKEKWQQVNEEYQKLPFSLDTPAKKKRKERYEEHLGQIEKDIQTLSRRVVLVVDKGKSQTSSSSGGARRHLASHI